MVGQMDSRKREHDITVHMSIQQLFLMSRVSKWIDMMNTFLRFNEFATRYLNSQRD